VLFYFIPFLKTNFCILIHLDNGCFQRLKSQSPAVFENFKVSKLLYVIQEDVERISNDRLERFISTSKGEMIPESMGDSVIKKRLSISLGDFVFVANSRGNLFCGRVIKFQYTTGKTKAAKKYKYKSVFFNLNHNVKFFLQPCFTLDPSGQLQSEDSPKNWFEKCNYCFTINNLHVDQGERNLSQEIMEKINIF
jgi:hypothetical protein